MLFSATTSSYIYDSLHRLTKADYGNGVTINYTYDAAGNRLTSSVISPLAPPVISTQPLSSTASVGGSATFSVAATGTGTLSYQWKKNGSPLAGATSASLALTGINSTHAGSYTVVITNSNGSATTQPVTSQAALLTVLQTTFANWQPAWFSPAEISNAAISGTLADPNYDGVSNWQSFVFGMNPRGTNPPNALPAASIVTQSGNRYLTFTYHRLLGINNIPYKVCVSDNLVTWDETESQIETAGNPVPTGDGLTETVTVRLKVPVNNGMITRKFFRLKTGTP